MGCFIIAFGRSTGKRETVRALRIAESLQPKKLTMYEKHGVEMLVPLTITPHIFTLHIAAGSGIEQQTSRRCKRSINIK